jgi:anti-sigma regulatory factor (Ser/Thr protein kinase)
MSPRRSATVSLRLAPGAAAPRVARTAVRKFLGRVADPVLLERAMLLTSELVTNAVIHAATPLILDLAVVDGVLHVQVEDGDSRTPVLLTDSGSHGGYGLHIVERLADSWGTAPRDNGKAVWFELSLRASVATGGLRNSHLERTRG